jgi:short-subunit dehydrogenase
MDVRDKVVILTGASGGIGQATARLLGGRGARLALVGRSADVLGTLAGEGPGAIFVAADLSDPAAALTVASRIVQHFGRVDVLVNCAGQGYDASVEKADLAKLLYLFRLHVVAPLAMIQAVIPGMRERRQGAIVNVSSGTSLMTLANNGPYSATKRALNGLTLTAAEELARDGIKVSLIYPFMTDTDFEARTTQFSDPAALLPDEEGETHELPPLDPPELVAGLILHAIESGETEVFAHDWMRPSRR